MHGSGGIETVEHVLFILIVDIRVQQSSNGGRLAVVRMCVRMDVCVQMKINTQLSACSAICCCIHDYEQPGFFVCVI